MNLKGFHTYFRKKSQKQPEIEEHTNYSITFLKGQFFIGTNLEKNHEKKMLGCFNNLTSNIFKETAVILSIMNFFEIFLFLIFSVFNF